MTPVHRYPPTADLMAELIIQQYPAPVVTWLACTIWRPNKQKRRGGLKKPIPHSHSPFLNHTPNIERHALYKESSP
ncbi:hypothetical protein [Pajaroellobacter abortibovis]|uniref:hypothetical protein n=1 Tax=Pajaroellobacter abortibovis TaxID=1882918 RepID=UPI0012ECA569|nr:hypothetical protein [Pajaroellobacter abortibovis]